MKPREMVKLKGGLLSKITVTSGGKCERELKILTGGY
jgi:hypothetical protein